MVIAHNILAMNAQRCFNINNTDKKKSTEKLSSGYKINRAADDAAGLAISEKMRRQIKGLTQASANAQDGISLVQVADGALGEMHEILQRMNVLSVQSANDTNAREDREYLQQETDQLISEIGRISNDTTFNEIPLFKAPALIGISGDYTNAAFDEIANINGANKISKSMDFSNINANNIQQLVGKSFGVTCSLGCGQLFTFKFTDEVTSSARLLSGGSKPDTEVSIGIANMTSGQDVVNAIYNQARTIDDQLLLKNGTADDINIGHDNSVAVDGAKLIFYSVDGGHSGRIRAADFESPDRVLQLQVGAEEGQLLDVNLYSVTPGKLGISDIDITTQNGAGKAITSLKGAINQVSKYRAYYGAQQNRLEHTIKNLDNVVENTTAAESAIRDTDMAKEMVRFSNLSILEQAGTSMMAQANQSKQSVLSLLQ